MFPSIGDVDSTKHDVFRTVDDLFPRVDDVDSGKHVVDCRTKSADSRVGVAFAAIDDVFSSFDAKSSLSKTQYPPKPNNNNKNENRRIVMSTNNTTIHRILVALAMPKPVPAFIVYVRNIVERITGNPYFPTPVPTPAAITKAADDLQVAEAAALTRVKGAVSVRNQKRAALVALLEQQRGYVQTVADAAPANSAAIVESSGLAVRKTTPRKPRVFAAKAGALTGTAQLVAPFAGARASYEWQYSTDGGKTWIAAPVTLQAKSTIAGLVPGATVQFKVRPVTRSGEGNWSEPVSLIVQ
jgi:hypothetical protein